MIKSNVINDYDLPKYLYELGLNLYCVFMCCFTGLEMLSVHWQDAWKFQKLATPNYGIARTESQTVPYGRWEGVLS